MKVLFTLHWADTKSYASCQKEFTDYPFERLPAEGDRVQMDFPWPVYAAWPEVVGRTVPLGKEHGETYDWIIDIKTCEPALIDRAVERYDWVRRV